MKPELRMLFHRLCLPVLAVLLLLPTLAMAETVVTSFFPIYLFTCNLTEGIDTLEVHNLAAPGTGCLHDYQLTTGDMKALQTADVFLINGAGMESYLDFALESLPDLKIVDASVGVELLEEDEDEDEENHTHDHGDYNAHIWLDASNAQIMVNNLAAGLMEACPAEAERIAANRDAYLLRLQALDAVLKDGLADVPQKDIITFHEAFPYFAKAYGLHVAAVVNREPDDALSPRQLAELVSLVESLGCPPLFTEPQYEDMAAQTISRETGAPIYALNPVVTTPEGALPLDYYETCMLENMAVLQEALGATSEK